MLSVTQRRTSITSSELHPDVVVPLGVRKLLGQEFHAIWGQQQAEVVPALAA
jgi:hypothetical protein